LECVASTLKQDVLPHEVIIVVNDNDPLVDRLALVYQGEPLVKVISAKPRGIATTRSTGLAAARGDLMAFVDDDALPESSWLSHLAAPFDDQSVIMTAGNIIPNWEIGQPSWFPEEFLWVLGCSYRGLPTTLAEVRNPFGASMILRRSVYEKVGDFNDSFGRKGSDAMGCEETEYAIRARKAFPDGKIMYVPDSRIDHIVPADRTTLQYFMRRCYREGIAKAALAKVVGADYALSSEKSYVWRTLAPGLARRIARPSEWVQALVLSLGLVLTAAGLLISRVKALVA
jgi:GT2 family glycosyltransferase